MNNKKKTLILIGLFAVLMIGASVLYNNLSANYTLDSLVVDSNESDTQNPTNESTEDSSSADNTKTSSDDSSEKSSSENENQRRKSRHRYR